MKTLHRWLTHGFYPFMWFRFKGACWGFCLYGSRGRNPLFAYAWSRTHGRTVMWRRPFMKEKIEIRLASEMDDITASEEPMVAVVLFSDQAEGAIPKDARVKKVREDVLGVSSMPVGSLGTVYSSMAIPPDLRNEAQGSEYGYYIIWDDLPQPVPVFTLGYKIAEEKSHE